MAKPASAPKKTTKTSAARARSATATKTTVRTAPAPQVVAAPARTSVPRRGFASRFNAALTPHALVGEFVATFVLATVTYGVTAPLGPLYVGLTYVLLALAIGKISGAHANPAVTFGLWTIRRFPGLAIPFYWLAQFIGALAAVLVLAALTGRGLSLDLTHFFSSFYWSVFVIELIGSAILLFGFTAAVSRIGLSGLGRAVGIGFSLFVALLLGTSLFASANSSVDKSKITSIDDVPRLLRLDGPVLNPAVALGIKEKTNNELQGSSNDGTEKPASRLTFGETLVAPLLGAAIGANLYRVLRRRDEE